MSPEWCVQGGFRQVTVISILVLGNIPLYSGTQPQPAERKVDLQVSFRDEKSFKYSFKNS